MQEQESDVSYINPRQARMRRRLGVMLRPVLRQEIIHTEENGLQRAMEAAREGVGTLILWNHFSERDGFDVAKRIVVQTPELVTRLNVFPVAQHQDRWPLPWLEAHGAFQYPFIVTSDTYKKVHEMLNDGREFIVLNEKGELEKIKDDGTQYLDLSDGKGKFLDLSSEAFSRGGSVSVSFQGGRASNLYLGEQDTVGFFLASMKRSKVANFGVLLVGVGDEKIKDYSKKSSKGPRPFKKTTVKIGPYFTLDELMSNPDVNGNRRNVDVFIRRQFVPLVPDAYLHPPTVEARVGK